MGIEPTPPADTARDYGFEDRGRHQPPSASVLTLSTGEVAVKSNYLTPVLSEISYVCYARCGGRHVTFATFHCSRIAKQRP